MRKQILALRGLMALRELMARRGLDAYIVNTGDPHMSEYVAEHFQFLKFLSGFTGERGLLAVTMDDAGLWTDSRFFIQAEAELAGSGITLYKEGTPGALKVTEFLEGCAGSCKNGGKSGCKSACLTIGLDGLTFSYNEVKALPFEIVSVNLAEEMWGGDADCSAARGDADCSVARPRLVPQKVWIFDEALAGESAASKLSRIREKIAGLDGTDSGGSISAVHIISSLDDIAWTLNLRGSDISCVPVFYSYLVISSSDAWLFAYEEAFDENALSYLRSLGVTLRPYENFFEELPGIIRGADANCSDACGAGACGADASGADACSAILLDPRRTSYELYTSVIDCARGLSSPIDCARGLSSPLPVKIINGISPALTFKAVKNPVEIQGFRAANILDGVAMCRFIRWVKSRVGERCASISCMAESCPSKLRSGEALTEISAAEKLAEFRREVGAFDKSFDTITAYGAHAAIVHYSANQDSNAVIEPHGFLLVDSGAHYAGAELDSADGARVGAHYAGAEPVLATGTTDITRTIAVGPLTPKMKLHYTLVLMGHIDYAEATFAFETPIEKIDHLARAPLAAHGLGYLHGTSHGIGNVLSVHEDLGRIVLDGEGSGREGSRRESSGRERKKTPLVPGKIFSDEPGIYIEGSHGVRIEGDLLCVQRSSSDEVGGLGFEMLTLCPYERDAIDTYLLSPSQLAWLNAYHARVRETLSPYLEGDDLAWLIAATAPLTR